VVKSFTSTWDGASPHVKFYCSPGVPEEIVIVWLSKSV